MAHAARHRVPHAAREGRRGSREERWSTVDARRTPKSEDEISDLDRSPGQRACQLAPRTLRRHLDSCVPCMHGATLTRGRRAGASSTLQRTERARRGSHRPRQKMTRPSSSGRRSSGDRLRTPTCAVPEESEALAQPERLHEAIKGIGRRAEVLCDVLWERLAPQEPSPFARDGVALLAQGGRVGGEPAEDRRQVGDVGRLEAH